MTRARRDERYGSSNVSSIQQPKDAKRNHETKLFQQELAVEAKLKLILKRTVLWFGLFFPPGGLTKVNVLTTEDSRACPPTVLLAIYV